MPPTAHNHSPFVVRAPAKSPGQVLDGHPICFNSQSDIESNVESNANKINRESINKV